MHVPAATIASRLFTALILGSGIAADAAESRPEPRELAPALLPASLPLRREAGAAGEERNWGPSLVLLVVAGAGGAWVFWRRNSRGRNVTRAAERSGQAHRLCSQPLTPQASIHTVRWKGEELLLGCTAQQVTLLSRAPIASSEEERA